MSLEDDLIEIVGRRVTTEGIERRKAGGTFGPKDEKMFARKVITDEIRLRDQAAVSGGQAPLSRDEASSLSSNVLDTIFGFAGLEELLNDPEVLDIHVNGCDSVWAIRQGGHKQQWPRAVAKNDEQLREKIADYVRRMSRVERRFDRSTPIVDMQLPNGDRLNATFGISSRPTMTIRRHNFALSRLSELRDIGSISAEAALFLSAAVKANRNIVISGGTGSGKTTLLRALVQEIPSHDRIITVEDSFELGLSRLEDCPVDLVEYEARPANLEGIGEITVADLVKNSLRANPDRIIVGECRGKETLGMILAMSQGNEGSLTTLHADSSRNALSRISTYCAVFHDPPMDPAYTVGLIRDAVHFVVHLERTEGVRRVKSIREVDPTNERELLSTEVFAANDQGLAVPKLGITSLRHKEALERVGFDTRLASGAAHLRMSS